LAIPGVEVRPLKKHADARGWLVELFRTDTLPDGFQPAMGYFSVTHPGIARGPHEHRDQTDGFLFFDGTYELHLWENRQGETEAYEVLHVGEENPVFVTVPPGVVHGYKNVGTRDAFVINIPDRLYGGPNRSEPVDEIRHEADENSRFTI
jgi:dTDP-4-dehydrorhamnose 3,5-epimerase